MFRFLVGAELARLTIGLPESVSIYPGFLASLGYLIIAGILVRAALFGGALLPAAAENKGLPNLAEMATIAIAPILGILGGLLPLFMYAQHVRLVLFPQ